MRQQLTDSKGRPKFNDPNDRRVIYSSPLVDVAGNLDLVHETIEACKIILELTNWQIRLLSKSSFLPRVADGIPPNHAQRMIYGVSTGTLDDNLAKAFEAGTPRTSKRIASLHELQDRGLRTFGMLCPSLPLPDNSYVGMAALMADAIRAHRCEHVWAEVINVRGESMVRTVAALRSAGYGGHADTLQRVSTDKEAWECYARATFLAHAQFVPGAKLRFLQYVDRHTKLWWHERITKGAVLL